MNVCIDKVYAGTANLDVLRCTSINGNVLDVGCGVGLNSAFLTDHGCKVWGITLSPKEAELARDHCENIHILNVEKDALPYKEDFFDTILLSHVLEHMVDPKKALCKLSRHLKHNGVLIIAVPNMAHWRLRIQFLKGNWERKDHGPLDESHLHFWSFATANRIFEGTPYEIISKINTSTELPLWPFRRFMPNWCNYVDRLGRCMPNLFVKQVIILSRLKQS